MIEGRRRSVSTAAQDQLRIIPSGTFADGRMNRANPAEQAWLKRTADGLQEASLDIFGREDHPRYPALEAWMKKGLGDEFSSLHFGRMRGIKPPAQEVPVDLGFEGPENYANLFPWFQTGPKYNGMLPDLSDGEMAYLMEYYTPDDPVQLPWTVVKRATPKELAAIAKRPEARSEDPSITLEWKKGFGKAVVWMVKGENGRWYRVTNMAFHLDYRPYFRTAAKILRDNAFLRVQGTTLHPQFRRYTLTMADSLERGDFLKLLRADLDQTEGNLFLTFFPHEGYWPDGIKYPLMFEVGIRETADMPPQELAVFQELEDITVQIAKESGLPYERRVIDSSDAGKAAVLYWQYRNGGFMRAYYREPAGHDYPKRPFQGLGDAHRNVIILDSTIAIPPLANRFVRYNFIGEGVQETEASDFIEFVKWHEANHGVGARPGTPTAPSGRKMSEVYGSHWGLLAEPLCDAGAAMATDLKHRKGLIDDKEYQRRIVAAIAMQFRRYFGKARASNDAVLANADAAHVLGSTLQIGWLFKKGVVEYVGDGKFRIHVDKYLPAIREYHAELTRFSLRDDLEGYKGFVKETVAVIPDEADAKIAELKKKYSPPFIINRNPGGIQ